ATGAGEATGAPEDGPDGKPKGKKKLVLKEIFKLTKRQRVLTINGEGLPELDKKIKEIINEEDVTLVQSQNNTGIFVDAEIIKEFDGTATNQAMGDEIFQKLNARQAELNTAAEVDGFTVQVLSSFAADSEPLTDSTAGDAGEGTNTEGTTTQTTTTQTTTTASSFAISTCICNLEIFLFIILSVNFFNLILN
ncbi:hypothetical protein BpHYR1_034664, partial [Brachionus plicatilis]